MSLKPYLKKLVSGNDLSEMEMKEGMDIIFSGNAFESQIGAFLAALALKKETYLEVAGAARSMRENALKIQTPGQNVIDTCGTGGDGMSTFNISTTVAFVAAGAGAVVAKHGNRSITSKSGSADVLEALNVKIDVDPEIAEECIFETGLCFLFAPRFHGAMKYAAKVRKDVGFKSIFNMLGPLTNPAGTRCQLIGVFAPELTEMFALALKELGSRRVFIAHGHDGLDEISVCAPTRISELNNDSVKTYDLNPEKYFNELAKKESIMGGTPQENAEITKNILLGKEIGPKQNIVLLNSAAALVAAGICDSIEEGLELSRDSINSGKAYQKLEALRDFTNENG
jgi:anthranilate phosphoribosyltransferase